VRARLPVSAVAQLGLDAVEQLLRAERKVRSNKRRQEILAEQRRVEREEAERQAAIRAEAERLELERLEADKRAAKELEDQARLAQKAIEKKEKARRYREKKKREKELERCDEQAQAAEGRLALKARHQIARNAHTLEGRAQHELTRVQHERLVVGDGDQLGEVVLRLCRVDERLRVVAEHAELVGDAKVNR
jgi:hypothetical protein